MRTTQQPIVNKAITVLKELRGREAAMSDHMWTPLAPRIDGRPATKQEVLDALDLALLVLDKTEIVPTNR